MLLIASSYSSSDDGSESDLTSNRSNLRKSQRRYSFCESDMAKIDGLETFSEGKEADSKSETKFEEEK